MKSTVEIRSEKNDLGVAGRITVRTGLFCVCAQFSHYNGSQRPKHYGFIMYGHKSRMLSAMRAKRLISKFFRGVVVDAYSV